MKYNNGFFPDFGWFEKTEWMTSEFKHMQNVGLVYKTLAQLATHKQSYFIEQYRSKLIVKRGQVVIGRNSLAEITKLTPNKIRYAIMRLIASQDIVTKSYHKFTLVTLCKYEEIVSGEILKKDPYLYAQQIKNWDKTMKAEELPPPAPSPTESTISENLGSENQPHRNLPPPAPSPRATAKTADFGLQTTTLYIEPNSKEEYSSDRSISTESMINKNSNNTSQSQNLVEKTENPLFSQNFVGMPTPEQLKALQDFAKKKHEEFLKLPDYPYGKEKRTGMPESYRLKQTGKDPLDEYRAKIITGDPLAEYRSKVDGEALRESYRKPFVRPQAEPKPYPTDTHFDQVMEDNELTGDIDKDDELLILGSKKSFYRDFDKRMKIFKRMIDGESPLEIVK